MRKCFPIGKKLLLIYLLLLGVSHVCKQFRRTTGPLTEGQQRTVIGDIQIAYQDIPAEVPGSPNIVLLHGSPMASTSWNHFLAEIRGRYRIIVPDLPGFGGSTRKMDDYSIRTHADYLNQLLDHLDIPSAHILGYSMGGGVALELYARDPNRVNSLTLLSSIGVQELELLGDYALNHAVHGAQLFGFWLGYHFTPNFGLLDDSLLNLSYCRNFYDTDQRPLRDTLKSVTVPTMIIHGDKDILVPLAAAKEHARLVPQSKVHFIPDQGHMALFTEPALIATLVTDFITKAESGQAQIRSQATPESLAASAQPFDYHHYSEDLRGRSISIAILLAIATLVSEDIACITAGLLVSQGAIGFAPATLGCLLGIFIGDVGLYLIGRLLGTRALTCPPLKWLIDTQKIERSKRFFERHGPTLIIASRFIPGMRLPTYIAGGMLKLNVVTFLAYFLLAAALWTPVLVGISTVIGERLLNWLHHYEQHALIMLAAVIILVLIAVHLAMALATHRGRRLLIGKWRRRLRWEFWPSCIIYTPVAVYLLWQMLRHRSITLFTAANPSIPHSGIALESKSQILGNLDPAHVARFKFIPHHENDKLAALATFSYPLVLKPDLGERGQGVAIIRDQAAAERYLNDCPGDIIVQEFIAGEELGILYHRHPNTKSGRISSITEKKPTTVTGDGVRTLESLILDCPRAVCSAPLFLKRHAAHLDDIPADGETVQLSQLGTHARGALFLDASHRLTEQLHYEIDRLSKSFPGFHIGRYDFRMDGEKLKVLELNGITSEPAHIYDPKHGFTHAIRTLCQHWRTIFEIAAQNKQQGTQPSSLTSLIRLIVDVLKRDKWEAPD